VNTHSQLETKFQFHITVTLMVYPIEDFEVEFEYYLMSMVFCLLLCRKGKLSVMGF
jgi:hypothetical protein